jgi:integrase
MRTKNKANVPRAPEAVSAAKAKKTIRCRQDDVDQVPLASGDWSVEDVPGLILRAGATTKSWRLQRRIGGRLVKVVLGPMSAAEARRRAMQEWARLKPRPQDGRITLGEAWERFLAERRLAPATQTLYRWNLAKHLAIWQGRALEDIGNDRAGVRSLCLRLERKHGAATANQVMRQLRAVYNYFRRIQPDLPEAPTVAVDLPPVGSRDWALSDDELRAWWQAVEKLGPLKQVFWKVMLLTGARRGSVEALRWQDVDLDAGRIRFSTAKAGRTYSIPACQRLVDLLRGWREECPPTEAGWVFPSKYKPEEHIVAARDDKRGVASAHHLRHTYRTVLAQLGCPPDSARLLLGHSLSGDVSRGYITAHLVVDSLRPWAEAVARRYAEILGWE